ncbi:MAG TPA: hypothetical protein VGQ85_10085 [Candidatus Limnocylindrales bacterium]|nr:hypothetical protein [Candidatus Limnocylindrales bacterium]
MTRFSPMTRSSACRLHRPALAGLAERRVAEPEGRAALEHVERCPACANELGELMLTVVVLRRMGAEAATAEPLGPDDAWSRLRARIERSSRRARQQAWQWRATVGGLATASLLVAVLVGPRAVHVTDNTFFETDAASAYRLSDRAETKQEEARLNVVRRNGAASSTHRVDAMTRPGSVPRLHPVEDEGGVSNQTPAEAPRSRLTGIRPI